MPATDHIARQSQIAAEIVALTGCTPRIADMAANHFLAFPTAPNFGLSGPDDRLTACAAQTALERWIASTADAQGQRVAA